MNFSEEQRRIRGREYHDQIYSYIGGGRDFEYLQLVAIHIGNEVDILADERLDKNKVEEHFKIYPDSLIMRGSKKRDKRVDEGVIKKFEEINGPGKFYDLCHTVLGHVLTDSVNSPLGELGRAMANLGSFGVDSSVFTQMYISNWVAHIKEREGFYNTNQELLKKRIEISRAEISERIDAEGRPTQISIEEALNSAKKISIAEKYYTQEAIENKKIIFDVPLIKKKVEPNEFAITLENALDGYIRSLMAKTKINSLNDIAKFKNIENVFSMEYKQNIDGIMQQTCELQKQLFKVPALVGYADDTEYELACRIAQDKAPQNQRLPFTTIEVKGFKEAGADMREKLTKIYSL